MLPLGPLLLLAAAAVVIVAAIERAYRARQYAALGLLAVAAERRLPLAPVLQSLAEEHGGRLGRALRELLARLNAGWPPHEALWLSPGVIPPDALPTLRVGYESGRFAEALRRAVEVRNADRPYWDAVSGKLVYLVVLLSFALSIVTFMALKIVPAFHKIYDDFNAEMPAITQWTTKVCGSYGAWALLLEVLSLVALAYAVLMYCGVRLPRLPGAGWLWRRRDTAAILEALALAADGGRPLIDAVASLADCFPASGVRSRLRLALSDMVGGRDWLESLRARRLAGTAEVGVLRAAQQVGNLPWALAEVADSCRRRHAYRAQVLLQVLFPAVILSIGLAVMVLVVAYFLPLIRLIVCLTPAVACAVPFV